MIFRLIGKLILYDYCSLINTKVKPITKVSDPYEKTNDTEERIFVDITRTFLLSGIHYRKVQKKTAPVQVL